VGGPKQWAVTLTQIWLSDRMIPNWSSMPSMRQNGATASADAPAHPVRAPLIQPDQRKNLGSPFDSA
jgi:hypothetical protein